MDYVLQYQSDQSSDHMQSWTAYILSHILPASGDYLRSLCSFPQLYRTLDQGNPKPNRKSRKLRDKPNVRNRLYIYPKTKNQIIKRKNHSLR